MATATIGSSVERYEEVVLPSRELVQSARELTDALRTAAQELRSHQIDPATYRDFFLTLDRKAQELIECAHSNCLLDTAFNNPSDVSFVRTVNQCVASIADQVARQKDIRRDEMERSLTKAFSSLNDVLDRYFGGRLELPAMPQACGIVR